MVQDTNVDDQQKEEIVQEVNFLRGHSLVPSNAYFMCVWSRRSIEKFKFIACVMSLQDFQDMGFNGHPIAAVVRYFPIV